MNGPLISIVVPFYNIKDYVTRCIGSLVKQSYNFIEIVCVDDGSTDGTESILNAWASRDERIKVFHKENGGLSSARNYGVAQSVGDYITFVDGDDCVSPYYIELLLEPIISGECSLTIGNHIRVVNHSDEIIGWGKSRGYNVLTREAALCEMLYDRPMISSWAHLAPRELYLRHPFPIGEVYEDTITFHCHIASYEKVAFILDEIYAYTFRPGSITSTQGCSLEKMISFYNLQNKFFESFSMESAEIVRASSYHYMLELSRLIYKLYPFVGFDSQARNLCKAAQKKIRRLLMTIIINKNVSIKSKTRLVSVSLSMALYSKLFTIYEASLTRIH